MTSTAATSTPALLRRPVVPAVVGGALWVPYGVLELVRPWGDDTRFDDERGYDVVVDPVLHHLTSLPGSLALLLCAVGLLVLLHRLDLRPAAAHLTSWSAAGLAAVSAVGVLLGSDPVFTGGRILGTAVLGIGLLSAGRAAGRTDSAAAWRPPLVALGVLSLFLLPVWPLVFAVQWLSPAAGAAVLGLHGLGWVVLGAAAPAGARR